MSLKETGIKAEVDYPPTHDFDEEPYIEGSIDEIRTTTIKDREARLAILNTPKGGQVTVWLNAVLYNLFIKFDVKQGDLVGIQFTGYRKSQDNPTFKYRMFELFLEPEKGKG